MTDIEIARNAKMLKIESIAKKINIPVDDLELYGKYKAKINDSIFKKLEKNKNGKLILVTAINPTPMGEGKTTVSIGLADAMNIINKKTLLALREPSLGPVFGMKGGAAGGGKSQITPMEDLNLHFTGDLHAITSANNLLSAMIDNHIYFGNNLGIDKVIWKRCLDLNDRSLRNIICGIGEKDTKREDMFTITAASEVMAVFCLANDISDLEVKLGNIVIGYTKNGKAITAKDLNANSAMTVILKDAIKPNLVQTLEGNPAIIHGGPFANIAHGCNSVIATKLALKLSNYVITEAGFGADLGAEKFLDIKCRKANLVPDAIVCVATIKALKYHGGSEKQDITKENLDSLENGLENLYKHVDNIKNVFGLNIIVALNKFGTDTDSEIEFFSRKLEMKNIEYSIVDCWANGGKGSLDLAEKTVKIVDKNKIEKINYPYNLEDSIQEKVKSIVKKIYGGEGAVFSEESLNQITKIEKMGYSNLPICIAKTQYSLTDDPKILKHTKNFTINVKEVRLIAGAGFIVIMAGNIFTMPGLPKVPAAENMRIDKNGNIEGIF